MKKLLFFLITYVFISSAFAYPITPCPLRKLVKESELIVWVKVIKTGSTKTSKKDLEFWERDYALLVVSEVLQGKLEHDTLKAFFTAGMICPAPGVFYENETVLAFLDKREKGDGYYVHALSYGVKHGLSLEDYQIYRSRILEMKIILNMNDSDEKDELIIDWLVKCAEQKSTRWEGVYELSPFNDFMSYYDQGDLVQKDIYLNSCQLTRLFDALMKVDTIEYPDLGLIDIVKGVNDSLLLSFLKSGLTRMSDDELWPASDVMQRIAKFSAKKELEVLLKKLEEIRFDYTDKSKAERKKIFSQFILEMKSAELKKNIAALGRLNT